MSLLIRRCPKYFLSNFIVIAVLCVLLQLVVVGFRKELSYVEQVFVLLIVLAGDVGFDYFFLLVHQNQFGLY